mgnify:CR=1 FL=1
MLSHLLYLIGQIFDDRGHVAHGRLHLTHELLLRLGRGDDAQLDELVVILLCGGLQLGIGRGGLADELLAVAPVVHLIDLAAVDGDHHAAAAGIAGDRKFICGNEAEYGEDDGELIIRDAEVVKVIC